MAGAGPKFVVAGRGPLRHPCTLTGSTCVSCLPGGCSAGKTPLAPRSPPSRRQQDTYFAELLGHPLERLAREPQLLQEDQARLRRQAQVGGCPRHFCSAPCMTGGSGTSSAKCITQNRWLACNEFGVCLPVVAWLTRLLQVVLCSWNPRECPSCISVFHGFGPALPFFSPQMRFSDTDCRNSRDAWLFWGQFPENKADAVPASGSCSLHACTSAHTVGVFAARTCVVNLVVGLKSLAETASNTSVRT